MVYKENRSQGQVGCDGEVYTSGQTIGVGSKWRRTSGSGEQHQRGQSEGQQTQDGMQCLRQVVRDAAKNRNNEGGSVQVLGVTVLQVGVNGCRRRSELLKEQLRERGKVGLYGLEIWALSERQVAELKVAEMFNGSDQDSKDLT